MLSLLTSPYNTTLCASQIHWLARFREEKYSTLWQGGKAEAAMAVALLARASVVKVATTTITIAAKVELITPPESNRSLLVLIGTSILLAVVDEVARLDAQHQRLLQLLQPLAWEQAVNPKEVDREQTL